MLFERFHTRNTKSSLKQHIIYFNFRSKIQLDHGLRNSIVNLADNTTGFFAAGLEYSTGCTSVVVGKPEAKFFQSAVDEINLEHGTDIRIGGSEPSGHSKVGIPKQ